MLGGEGGETEQGAGDRDPTLLTDCAQLSLCARDKYTVTDEQHRALGAIDEGGRLLESREVDYPGARNSVAPGDLRRLDGDLFKLSVLGDVDQHGPRSTPLGNRKCLRYHGKELFGRGDLEVPFGDGDGDADDIGLLEGVSTVEWLSHLTGDTHQRD